MTTPIPNCPQPETPIRDRAWTEVQIEAMQRDAARWRHARKILPVEYIEESQREFDHYGVDGDEMMNLEADRAIDAAMNGATP